MINLLLGPPGGGKSYEAVVFHILTALQSGRKVITNLPLVVSEFAAIDSSFPALIDLRHKTRATRPEVDWQKAESLYKRFGIAAKNTYWPDRVFAHPDDYGDTWRHPETGSGPLYVVDECHLALPRGSTVRAVEEWYSMHRHESADVLLITQSAGKVSKSIIDLVQVCYRVKKATAFGANGRYIRKVLDGVRGEVVNTAVREYKKQYFKLYVSHTRGGGAELAANDIVPIWRRWPVIGAAILLPVGCVGVVSTAKDAFVPKQLETTGRFGEPLQRVVTVDDPEAVNASAPVVEAPPAGSGKGEGERVGAATAAISEEAGADPVGVEPYGERGLHLQGELTLHGRREFIFGVSQGGQSIGTTTGDQLRRLGYVIEIPEGSHCAGWLVWQRKRRAVICDSPTVGIGGGSTSRS